MANEDSKTKKYSLEKKDDGTISFKIKVPWQDIEKIREEVTDSLIKQVELPGFRKGTVPKKLAEEKLNQSTVKEEVLKKVLSKEYVEAVRDAAINPVINPKIHVEAFEYGTDLEFEADTCETPQVSLNNYKEAAKKVKPASPKIIIPGKEIEEKTDEAGKKLDEILAEVLKIVDVKIPKILIDQETDRLLSQLVDELKRLGVSLDQYLASRNKKAEELRAEYDERAEKDLKLEFVLRKIADEEKITVEQKDIENAVASIKDEKQKQEISQNPYLVAAIIRQQKTLDFLSKI